MKTSKLLSTTVLVSAAAMLAAAPASAAKLKLGGYYEQWMGFGKNASNAPVSDFDLQNDAEIYFSFKEKLSNGLTVGGRFEMEAGNGNSGQGSYAKADSTKNQSMSDMFDETSVYVSGAFGKLTLGNNDVAASGAGGVSVVGPVGIIKSDAGDWINVSSDGSKHLNNDNDLGMGDAQKIHYQTPKVNGLQLAVSYMPDSSDGKNSVDDKRETDGNRDGISALVKYSGKLGGTGVTLGLGFSSVEKLDITSSSNARIDGKNIGLKVTQGPYTITAAHMTEEKSSTEDNEFTGVGLIYKLDKVNSVSFGWGQGSVDKAGTTNDQENTVTTIGFKRSLGKGVSVEASLFNNESDDGSSTNYDDNGLVGGIKVNF